MSGVGGVALEGGEEVGVAMGETLEGASVRVEVRLSLLLLRLQELQLASQPLLLFLKVFVYWLFTCQQPVGKE